MNIFKLSRNEVNEGIMNSRLIRLAILVVCIVPLLYGVLYLWAFWDPYSKLDNMPVAVVNEDVDYVENGKTTNIGQELVDTLQQDKVLDWEFVSDEEAKEGLQSQKYFAEIKIPSDFSEKISKPEKSTIIYTARESNSMIGAQLSSRVASEIASNLGRQLSQQYLDNIFFQTQESAESIQQASDGASQLSDGLSVISNGAEVLAKGSSDAYGGSDSLLNGMNKISLGSGDLNNGLEQTYAGSVSLDNGIAQSASGAQSLANGSAQLKTGVTQVNSGVNQLISNSSTITSQLVLVQNYLSDPSTLITDSTSPFYGYTKLQAANAIISGIVTSSQSSETVKQLNDLKTGLSQVQSGADSVNSGVVSLSNALNNQIYPGSSALVTALNSLSVGSGSLDSAIKSATQGTGSLSSGLKEIASGSDLLNSGVVSAQNGSQELAQKLSDGAREAMQSSEDALSQKLSNTISNPVSLADESISKVANYGTGFSPYFIPLALWVGSLVIFLVIKISKKDIRGMKPKEYFLGKFLTLIKVGTIQAVILDLVLILALGLRPLNYILFFTFSILISWAFLAILEFLIAVLQDGGKFLGIVLLMLQLTSASGTYPVQTSPAFFQKISSYLPMTYAVRGLREIISGGNLQIIWSSFAIIIIFMVVFLSILMLFSNKIAKNRMDLTV